MKSVERPGLALAVNLSGQSASDVVILLESLKPVVEEFKRRNTAPIKLIYAVNHSDTEIYDLLEKKSILDCEVQSLFTTVKNNASLIANRLLKECFSSLDLPLCLLLPNDKYLHKTALVQAYAQQFRTPETVIGSRFVRFKNTAPAVQSQKGESQVSSYGLLIPVAVYRKTGGFDCTQKYDEAAAQYVMRAKENGFKLILLDPRAGSAIGTTRETTRTQEQQRVLKPLQSQNNQDLQSMAASAQANRHQQFINEYEYTKSRLDTIELTLRSLSPNFANVSKLFSYLPVKHLKVVLKPVYKLQWVHNSLAVFGTILGWIYFRARLPGLFQFITKDSNDVYDGTLHRQWAETLISYEGEIRELSESGLFDLSYYLSQAPDAANHHLGPIGHYLTTGWHLSPHRLFDPEHYLAANDLPSVASSMAPLLHYCRTTGIESYSPHPLFDAVYYVHGREDLSATAETFNPLIHYLRVGAAEHVDTHPLFSHNYYYSRYHQIIGPKLSLLEHFVLWGHTGKFSPNALFDSEYYIAQNHGLQNALINPLVHYVKLGWKKGAKVHRLFDKEYYFKQLPESEIVDGDPLTHFLISDAGKTISAHPSFDAEFYIARTPHVEQINRNAFEHYLSEGEVFGLDPHPLFHTRWYRGRHPELQDTLVSPLNFYVANGCSPQDPPHPFCENHSKSSLNYLGKASPGTTLTSLDKTYIKLLKEAEEPFTHLFLMPGLVHGGAERSACNYIKFLQSKYGKEKILIIFSVYEEHSAIDWLPEGSRYIDLQKLLVAQETFEDKGLLQAALIMEKRPAVVHCINSYNIKMALSRYRELLEPLSRYVIYLFGYEAYTQEPCMLANSQLMGALRWIDCLITDSKRLADLILEYFPERRKDGKQTVCCYNSTLNLTELLDSGKSPRGEKLNKILWASRLVKSKRPDLLLAIARRLPEFEFLVHGSTETSIGDEQEETLAAFKTCSNIKYFGGFENFSTLDKTDVGLFLYTSQGDGIPIVLLEAAACGLPIVAPNVGGIGEFIGDETGWLVNKYDDIEGYVKAILEILKNPQMAKRKATAAKELTESRHSLTASFQQLTALPEFF